MDLEPNLGPNMVIRVIRYQGQDLIKKAIVEEVTNYNSLLKFCQDEFGQEEFPFGYPSKDGKEIVECVERQYMMILGVLWHMGEVYVNKTENEIIHIQVVNT